MLIKLITKIKNYLIFKFNYKLHKLLFKQSDLFWKLRSEIILRVKSQEEWYCYNEIFIDEEYDIPIKMTIEKEDCNRALNFLDLGANVGFFTFRVVDLIKRSSRPNKDFNIILIEGSPSTFKELKSRLSEQPELSKKATLLNNLIGYKHGSDLIYECNEHIRNSIFKTEMSKGKNINYLDINSIKETFPEIDLLKCDIEGSELIFLKTYKDDLMLRVKSAVFELHHNFCNPQDCIDLMKNIGFSYHKKLRTSEITSLHYFQK